MLKSRLQVPGPLIKTEAHGATPPATSEATKRAVEEHGRELTRVWRPLFSKALGEAAKDEDLVRYAFLTIRGYLSAGTMAARLAPQRPDGAIRTLLLRGVACAIRERAAEAGLGTGDLH